MPADECPAASDLAALVRGQLGADRATRLEDHVGGCSRCQGAVDSLAENLALTAALRRDARDPPVVVPEAIGELVARLDDLASQFSRVGWNDAGPPDHADRDGGPDDLALPTADGEAGRLGPYRVLRLLGAGGMGLVYLAEDTGLRRPVALKLLRPHLARHPRARDGFLSEARAMAAIKHDNVVTVFQIGETPAGGDGLAPYLVMELLDGESLADWLRREGPVPVGQAARLGRQAAEGLGVAHARGVIHRDIKPGNLWLEAPPGWGDAPPDRRPPLAAVGRLKILDFGLAQPVDRDSESEVPGFGTPAYMPPEQARGERLSPRADLFSLGVVLYEMATGRLPFPVTRGAAIPDYRPPEDLRTHAPDAPPPFAELVHRLLSLKPQERPESAREVAVSLTAVAETTTAETLVTASALTVPIRPVRPTRRWRAVVGAALVVAVVGSSWLASRSFRTSTPDSSVTELSRPPDDEWCQHVSTLPPEQQVAAVIGKLREINPGFGGAVSVRYVDGHVNSLAFSTDAVHDIRPVRALTRLQRLECNGSARDKGQLSDLSPIRDLRLVELNCWWNRDLRDMSMVRGMPLQSSQFGETPVEDLTPFTGLPLTKLCVNGCPVRDISVVRSLPNLQFFNCRECPVESLEPLAGLMVQHLIVDFRTERDADILRRMPELTQINWVSVNEFRRQKGLPGDSQ